MRDHCQMLSDKYQTPFHMAGYTMVEALREMNVEKVALNAVCHWPDWWQGTAAFLTEAGFDVLWAVNFVDQGWFATQQDARTVLGQDHHLRKKPRKPMRFWPTVCATSDGQAMGLHNGLYRWR